MLFVLCPPSTAEQQPREDVGCIVADRFTAWDNNANDLQIMRVPLLTQTGTYGLDCPILQAESCGISRRWHPQYHLAQLSLLHCTP